MTAKHRKGKSNHKQEDNFFKNEAIETEVRAGGNNYTLLAVLVLINVIGGAIGAWFCFQQYQTLTSLTDNLMGIQMKIVKLQSSHEELRQSKSKHVSENVETRLTALEESNALTQKQVGMALATAEQLKTSNLPAQVLSLHTEMKARLAEMQQATVSQDQLGQLQSTLKEKSEEFEDVRIQVAGLATLNGELSHKVEVLTESLGEAESMLGEKVGQIATLSAGLDGQTTEVLILKDQLDKYQAQLEASVLEMATVRELLENEQSQRLQQAIVEEQLNTLVGETQPPAEPLEQTEEHAFAATEDEEEEAVAATEEEEEEAETDAAGGEEEEVAAAATGTEEAEIPTAAAEEEEETEAAEQGEAVSQDAAPVEQDDSETEESAAEEEVEAAEDGEAEQEEAVAPSEMEEVDVTQSEEDAEAVEEEDREADEEGTPEQLPGEEENQEATDEDESEKVEEVMESEGEEEEQQDVAAEEEPQVEEEEAVEDDPSPEDK